MKVLGVTDYDIVNYKVPSMFIAMPYCSFKCEKECGDYVCQNRLLAQSPKIEVSNEKLLNIFTTMPLTKAVVFGGLEPFDSWNDIKDFIQFFRQHSAATVVIYTGYKEEEVNDKIEFLSNYSNIIIKFGRFIPNSKGRYDEILGITLASENQYAKEIEYVKN